MDDFRIGIVMPSFNQGKYIERAIKSVISNKENADIYFVIIDGGSTDETVDIIKKYENKIDYWQSQPDQGQAFAINYGMRLLKDCKYVMWLNSDDVYETADSVRKIAEFAEEKKADFCYGKSYLIDENDLRIGSYETRDYYNGMLAKMCYISQPSVLISKMAWDRMGGLNESLHMCLDYEMWIRISMTYSVFYFDEYVGNTRIYGDTKSTKSQLRHLNEGIAILNHYYGKVPGEWIRERAYYQSGIRCHSRCKRMIMRLNTILLSHKYILMAEKESDIVW